VRGIREAFLNVRGQDRFDFAVQFQVHHDRLRGVLFGMKRPCSAEEQKKRRGNSCDDFVFRIARD